MFGFSAIHSHPFPFILVLLRGVMPGDIRYDRGDIIRDLDGVLCTQSNELLSVWLTDGELDDEGNPWTTDTIFSKRIAKEFIDTRSLILGGLIDGLSLRGKRDTSLEELHKGSELSGLLSHVPIAACSKILFARPNLSYDDVYTSIYAGEFHWFSTKLFSGQLSMHTRSFYFQFIMPPHHTNQRIGRRQMERPKRI